ncbi:fructokinase [Agaricicola taiwanensis]|uniref:Fructokinase n=1 Tax=Agaricicola taiwanensis TaxID=591372 RepID=A0A8J2YK50_9RHOB|nr:carbohydrate kinase [Agaricicola taiwanensis]GGE48556.1 fructokinase [Agaricicola taiwanensis]
MLLSCGDSLIDFMPMRTADGREAFIPVAGGSCLNVAVAMARLGAQAGFVGGISTDMFGAMIAAHAEASGVSLACSLRPQAQTTLAFVRLADGEPSYAFYDESSATRQWRHEAGAIPFERVEALHIGSTSLIADQGHAEGLKLVDEAKARCIISFDPNCRPNLVTDLDDYRGKMEAFMVRADILRLSDVDFSYLYGDADVATFAAGALADGVSLMVLTEGEKGARAWTRTGMISVEALRVDVADTIGAGDTFQGALMVALLEGQHLKDREALSAMAPDDVERCLLFAAKCAAVTCSRAGANPPWRYELPA